MSDKIKIFVNGDYKLISQILEVKFSELKNYEDFNTKSKTLSEKIENLSQNLDPQKKEELDDIIDLFYETEAYYFAFSYLYGLQLGKDAEKI